jgi:hypothetical protein
MIVRGPVTQKDKLCMLETGVGLNLGKIRNACGAPSPFQANEESSVSSRQSYNNVPNSVYS